MTNRYHTTLFKLVLVLFFQSLSEASKSQSCKCIRNAVRSHTIFACLAVSSPTLVSQVKDSLCCVAKHLHLLIYHALMLVTRCNHSAVLEVGDCIIFYWAKRLMQN